MTTAQRIPQNRTLGASGVSLISGENSLYMSSGVSSRPAAAGTMDACGVGVQQGQTTLGMAG